MNAHLFRNAVHVLLRNASDFHYLARVHLIDLVLHVRRELRFANFSVLADAKYFIDVDQIPVHFPHLWNTSRLLLFSKLLGFSYWLDL